MSTSTRTPAGTPLEEPCRHRFHGLRGVFFAPTEFDPNCPTCFVRDALKAHDHLHLNPKDAAACTVPGLNGVPGQTVRCKCGAFHH